MSGLDPRPYAMRKVYSQLSGVGRSLYTHVKTSAFNEPMPLPTRLDFRKKYCCARCEPSVLWL